MGPTDGDSMLVDRVWPDETLDRALAIEIDGVKCIGDGT